MFRSQRMCAVLTAGAALMLTGCMPKMTVEQMREMRPERPAELDRLNAFAGKWEFTGEAKMAMLDEPLEASGSSEARWKGDDWYLVSDGVFRMGELGEMKGTETWTYDAHSKKYRSTWVDNMGTLSIGESRYNEKTSTWNMKATSYGPHGKTWLKGTLEFIDDDTIEWSMTEYFGLTKTMEMSGTSHRRK